MVVALVQRRRRTKEEMRLREWKQTELKALEEQLLLFGEGNTPKIRSLVRDHTFPICNPSFPLSLSRVPQSYFGPVHICGTVLPDRIHAAALQFRSGNYGPGHGPEDPQSSRDMILILLYYRVGAF